ncbi:MAG: NAD-dependent protein deacetylase [Actinomycetales bacterium]
MTVAQTTAGTPDSDVRVDLGPLTEAVAAGEVAVLSGAGLSTESGIPDYRGPSGAARRVTPMTYQVFTREPEARVRYWARSHLGWRMFDRAAPNDGHRAVAALQELGLLSGIVTQNVDGLHSAAGASGVIELHGNLDRVVCLDCGDLTPRSQLAARLDAANPGWQAEVLAVNPDGDVTLPDEALRDFRIVACERCAGVLKPDVVYFGETVPQQRVADSYTLVERSRLLLVLGSSLTVMSGRRFVLRAAKLGLPVAIVNQGQTRGDDFASIRLEAPLGATLTALVSRLSTVEGAA